MTKDNSKTFVKISNNDIWEKLCKIHDDLTGMKEKVKLHDRLIWGVLIVIVLYIVKVLIIDAPSAVMKLVN